MLRFLRAWAWVRWRVRVNAIERGDRAAMEAGFAAVLAGAREE